MASLPWIGLIVSLAAVLGGMAIAGVRGLAAWRVFRSFERRLDPAIADLTRLVDGIEPRMTQANDTAVNLQEARTRLQESLAVAAVLVAALDETRALVRRVTGFVPR
jgi:hypothetical protein